MNDSTDKRFQIMFVSSGKSVQDLGNYMQCITVSTLKYALVTVKGNSGNRKAVQMGLCVPEQCTEEDLHIFDKIYMQTVIISGTMQEPQTPIYTFP